MISALSTGLEEQGLRFGGGNSASWPGRIGSFLLFLQLYTASFGTQTFKPYWG